MPTRARAGEVHEHLCGGRGRSRSRGTLRSRRRPCRRAYRRACRRGTCACDPCRRGLSSARDRCAIRQPESVTRTLATRKRGLRRTGLVPRSTSHVDPMRACRERRSHGPKSQRGRVSADRSRARGRRTGCGNVPGGASTHLHRPGRSETARTRSLGDRVLPGTCRPSMRWGISTDWRAVGTKTSGRTTFVCSHRRSVAARSEISLPGAPEPRFDAGRKRAFSGDGRSTLGTAGARRYSAPCP